MEHSRGRIVSVAKDHLSATVEVDTAVFCARCASGKGCGAGIFGSDSRPRRIVAPVVGGSTLREGDEVCLELAPESLLHAALTVYGIPLVSALVATGIAYFAGLSEGGTVLAAASGIAAGAFISRRRLQKSNCLRRFTPVITTRAAGPPADGT